MCKRYRIFFRRSVINSYFSIVTGKAFFNSLNNEIYRRIYRFKVFSFNDNVYVKFNSFSSSSLTPFIKGFDNYNISRNYI